MAHPASMSQRSLRAAVFAHRNDYGFDAATPPQPAGAPSVTCVIPYCETGSLASEVVALLLASLRNYRDDMGASMPDCGLVVVDDGSRLRPFQAPSRPQDIELQIVRLESNQGRSRARNAGVRAASASGAEVTVFVDSDVLVSNDHIANLLRAMQPSGHTIAASFFMTVRSTGQEVLEQALGSARVENDWRAECVYEPRGSAVRRISSSSGRDSGCWRKPAIGASGAAWSARGASRTWCSAAVSRSQPPSP